MRLEHLVIAAIALAPYAWHEPTARPLATFTAVCPNMQCTFDASASTGVTAASLAPVLYEWDWGDGRSESHRQPITRNTFGVMKTYTVRLIVTDANGAKDTAKMLVQVPTPTILRVRVDTVKLAGRVDTVKLAGRVDTVRVPGPTVTLLKHDTIAYALTALPNTAPGLNIADPSGEARVYRNGVFLGRVTCDDANKCTAYRYTPGIFLLKAQGDYIGQQAAAMALDAPAPSGFVP